MCTTCNEEMYGLVDLESYAAEVAASEEYRVSGLAMYISQLISHAQDELPLCSTTAVQTLNRAKFLIARNCPLPRPEAVG